MKGSVLVSDGEVRAALAVVRSLGRAGRRVHVVASAKRPLAGGSRYATSEHRCASPLTDPARFAGETGRLARDLAVDWVLPITDAAMLALTSAPERLAPARVPFPSWDVVRLAGDKREVAVLAQQAGISIPGQVVLEVPGRAPSPPWFPCYVKPSRSVVDGKDGLTRLAARPVSDAEAFHRILAELPAGAWPLLVQQRIEGPGIGVFLLRWDRSTRAVFGHRRLREKPPSGGVSVYRESVEVPPDLLARSEALLDRIGWFGPAMVEYKVDETTGTPYLMEINARYWGSLQLAADAGVDFPRLHLDLAEGTDVGPVPAYQLGVRSRWELGDIDHLLARLLQSRESLGLPVGTPGRMRAIAEVLASNGGRTRNEVLRSEDPRPFLRELAGWLRGRSS